LIYQRAGIALSDSKHALVNSRLRRRVVALGLTTFTQYLEHLATLSEDHDEFTHLTNCITTNKTDFFREPHHFEFVARDFLPALIARANAGLIPKKLRVWHAGCSTGEEPYTLSMVLLEGLQDQRGWDVRQLATDIDTKVLAHANKAIYDTEKASQIPEPYRAKYMTSGRASGADCSKVIPAVRNLVTFRRVNLHDPWPIRDDVQFDMIFCRNVMIYFDKATQRKLLDRFAQRLKPNGYLMLGHSENTLGLSDRFVPLGGTIYQLPIEQAEAA
jgi:chemotaxis protein methyltransferase CheR